MPVVAWPTGMIGLPNCWKNSIEALVTSTGERLCQYAIGIQASVKGAVAA